MVVSPEADLAVRHLCDSPQGIFRNKALALQPELPSSVSCRRARGLAVERHEALRQLGIPRYGV